MEYSRENFRKCIKCRASVAQDPTISLHRFPKPGKTNSLRCLLWAKYCFPSDAWFSTEFQEKLYNQHKVLCSKHFKTTCFIGRKLFKTAVPGEIENLETPSFGSSNKGHGPSHILQPMTVNRDITNELDKSLQNEIPVSLDPIKDDKKSTLYRKMRYNLFSKYDVKCHINISSNNKQGIGIAKWAYIRQFYEMDTSNPNFVYAPCLKQEHLNPNTKQKMKVKLAAQVLSRSVGIGMNHKIATDI